MHRLFAQEIHCSEGGRFYSLSGIAKSMTSEDGAASITSGVCVYIVTDALDDKGALPVTSASGE